ncbi:MAG: type II toxin-antitoxin system RelE/ParE family toxin, partial [Nostocaceae cyanobacterium]|nr:type II toxin-antitoxin system RelE/ParE family toxin [Nostocaceae cyanobacterium]
MESKKSPVKVFFSGRIKKDIKKLSKRYDSIEKDIEPFIRQLEAGEIIGDKISENKYPVFKARIKNSDIKRGKSGGYRAIYYEESCIKIINSVNPTIYSYPRWVDLYR